MKPSKGTDQSYELNCLSNEAKEGGLRRPTCYYTSPNAIVVGVAFGTKSVWATFTLSEMVFGVSRTGMKVSWVR